MFENFEVMFCSLIIMKLFYRKYIYALVELLGLVIIYKQCVIERSYDTETSQWVADCLLDAHTLHTL